MMHVAPRPFFAMMHVVPRPLLTKKLQWQGLVSSKFFLKSRGRDTSHQRGGPRNHFLPKQLIDKLLLFMESE